MEKSKVAVILGSSRLQGNTYQIANAICKEMDWQLFNLSDYEINYFDYDNAHATDDFLPLITRLIEDYDAYLFATPVYWYAMSAQLKTFFDRLSDLLKFYKPLGRQLRGKAMGSLSCANDAELIQSFGDPFEATADYLGMSYHGHMHTWLEEDEKPSPLLWNTVQAYLKAF
ncbi:MAG: NAD(P)H-dependent oxidoreductase [Bacteroidota bacterium]